MGHDERPPNTEASYRFLHRTAEELAQLQPEELLQAVLEERTLLQVALEERTPLQIFTGIWSHLR